MRGTAQCPRFLAGEPLLAAAYGAACEAHRGQVREFDGAPFIVHPVEVARILHRCGASTELVAVGLLHDAVEKGGTTIAAIGSAFGRRIAATVAVLTDDPAISAFAERKARVLQQVALGDDAAVMVLAADKVAKARELRAALAAGRPTPARLALRHAHYTASLRLVERRIPGHPLARALDAEVVRLTAEREKVGRPTIGRAEAATLRGHSRPRPEKEPPCPRPSPFNV
jgi:hypothetical protein